MPRRVGRPKGEASPVVNLRLPVSLVQRLDRYLDKLETETGLNPNRGMILRHALKVFLEAKGMSVPRHSACMGGGDSHCRGLM